MLFGIVWLKELHTYRRPVGRNRRLFMGYMIVSERTSRFKKKERDRERERERERVDWLGLRRE